MSNYLYPLSFFKYTGCGNDFILIDDRQGRIPATVTTHISALCNRYEGIGGDGVLVIRAGVDGTDVSVSIYNADGSEAALCGNGLRCVVRCLHEDLNLHQETYRIATASGIYTAKLLGETVEVQLGHSSTIQGPLRLEEIPNAPAFTVVVGVPHAVIVCNDIKDINVREIGRSIRFNTNLHPDGVNVNFVSQIDPHTLSVRTYERGVEDETLACGTGAASAAIVLASYRHLSTPLDVITHGGGTLRYHFKIENEQAKNIVMRGEAHRCFQGIYRLPLNPVFVSEFETLRGYTAPYALHS